MVDRLVPSVIRTLVFRRPTGEEAGGRCLVRLPSFTCPLVVSVRVRLVHRPMCICNIQGVARASVHRTIRRVWFAEAARGGRGLGLGGAKVHVGRGGRGDDGVRGQKRGRAAMNRNESNHTARRAPSPASSPARRVKTGRSAAEVPKSGCSAAKCSASQARRGSSSGRRAA